jgi:hypothetical protein
MNLRGAENKMFDQKNTCNAKYQEGREFRGTRSRAILNRRGSNMRQKKARVKMNTVL